MKNIKTYLMYGAGIAAGLAIAFIIITYGQNDMRISIGAAVAIVAVGVGYEYMKSRTGKKKEKKQESNNNKDNKNDKKKDGPRHITSEPLYSFKALGKIKRRFTRVV